jgi:sec-independent protein translocase protein TatA
VGPIGVPELIFIFLIALLVFGPRKLPELGRTLGKAMTEFRRASNDLRYAVEEEMREAERATEDARRQVKEAVALDEVAAAVSADSPPAAPQPPRHEEKPANGSPKPA